MVTLTGHVSSFAQKVAAVSASAVKGVHGLADEIEVRYAPDATASDDEEMKRAISMLGWDSDVTQSRSR